MADDELFSQAMAGVKPLRREGRKVVRSRLVKRPDDTGSRDHVPFEIEVWGEQMTGLAPGGDGGRLSALRRGKPPAQRQLDLHGFDREEARAQVRRFLRQSLNAGLECVCIVHGRGRRSEEGPVLKRALPDWLSEPAHGPSILAFATAPPNQGGGGATLVLLRSDTRRPSP